MPLESLVSRFVVRCSASVAESWLLALSPLQERLRLAVCAHGPWPCLVHIHLASAAARRHTGRPVPPAGGGTFPVAVSALLLAERVPGWISQSHTHSPESSSARTGGRGAGTVLEKGGRGHAPDRIPRDNARPQGCSGPWHRPFMPAPPGLSSLHTWGIGSSSIFKGQRHNSQLSSLERPLAGQNQLPWLRRGCPECGWTRILPGALGCGLVTTEGGGWAGSHVPQLCTWAPSQGWQLGWVSATPLPGCVTLGNCRKLSELQFPLL